MEETEDTVSKIRECIKFKDPLGIKKLILEDKIKDDSLFWELVSLLGDCINKDNLESSPGLFDVCERCLRYIIRVGNGKELLLALLEQAETFDDGMKFKTFVELIKQCILKIPSKQLFSIELALETLSNVIANLELSTDVETDEESLAEELDPGVENMNDIVSAYLHFLEPFVDQVAITRSAGDSVENDVKQRDILTQYILKLFEHPFLSLNVKEREGQAGMIVKPNARVASERAITFLLKLNKSIYEIVDQSILRNEQVALKLRWKSGEGGAENLVQVSDKVLGSLEYLVFVEKLAPFGQPCLVWKVGLLEMSLPFIRCLLSVSQNEPRKKGVALLNALIPEDKRMLTLDDLKRPEYFEILGSLFTIMIHSPMKSLREECLRVVPQFIEMFEDSGRYQISMKLFGTLEHAGAVGYCVQLLKGQLQEIFTDQWSSSKTANVFTGLNLKRLFLLITALPDGPATDLVESSDHVIAVLNLIRYLVLKDPPNQNITGFWDFCTEIEKNFLDVLQTGLDMAKAHYQMEVKGLEEENKKKGDLNEEVEMSVSVAGFKLPRMARGQKIAIMNQALNTLDLITSLLVRVNELIEQQAKMK